MTMKNQTKLVAFAVFTVGLIALALSSLTGCGSNVTYIVQGPPGPQGVTGPTGANGVSIVSTVTPDVSSSCTSGGDVILMAQDTDGTGAWAPDDLNQTSVLVCNGATGVTGPTGAQGTAGTNATPVSVVQFCSGYTTTYPSIFPEFGVCISGSLFAVYWDSKNAWLAEVVPGYYESTSTSAPCNFTVAANCQVSN